MIAVKHSVSFQLQEAHSDPNGRYIILVATLDGKLITLVNLYAPNTKQNKFFCGPNHADKDNF